MNTIAKKSMLGLLLCFFIFGLQNSFAQGSQNRPWTKDQVVEPAQLAAEIRADSAGNILILNTGPVDDIKGAVNIGAVEYKKNVRKLKNTSGIFLKTRLSSFTAAAAKWKPALISYRLLSC